MSHYLGIDIGTYQSKGVLVDGKGAILATAMRPHKMLVPQPGWAEHRADEDWWADFCAISREVIASSGVAPSSILAVAASAIGPCMLPVDRDGRPLMNAVLYGVDTRATAEIADLNDEIGSDVIFERCGNALTAQSVGPKILWLRRQRQDLYAKAAKILTSTSYLVWRLTGEYVIDHYTAANFSPLYDVEALGWFDRLTSAIIPLDRLPRPAWSTEIAGAVTEEASRETGLAKGTKVTVGTVDAAAEALSAGVLAPGEMMIMYGSTIFTIMLSAERIRDPRLWYAPWLFPGQHASMAGLATSGTLTHWFREQFARELAPEEAVARLAAEAGTSPEGARGLVLLPYFSGERTPIHDPDARGVLFGLDLTHGRADIYRALLEGIGCATNHIVETYREIGQPPLRVYAVGGGTNNPVWLQATSDISSLEQVVPARTVGASYGDAFMAACATGDADIDDIRRWNPVERRLAPRAEHAETYARQFEKFRQLYEKTRPLLSAGLG